MSPLIDIQQLRVSKSGKVICQLDELAVQPGDRLCITGPNGSGKTTLLRVLAGLERNFAGRCRVAVAASQRTYVHQTPYLFRGTVWDNMSYGLRGRGLSRSECKPVIGRCLERFGLLDHANATAKSVSGGERKRVAIGRALVLEPKLLLLDEPFVEVDDEGIATISQMLQELPRETTMIMTHPNSIENPAVSKTVKLTNPAAIGNISTSGYE